MRAAARMMFCQLMTNSLDKLEAMMGQDILWSFKTAPNHSCVWMSLPCQAGHLHSCCLLLGSCWGPAGDVEGRGSLNCAGLAPHQHCEAGGVVHKPSAKDCQWAPCQRACSIAFDVGTTYSGTPGNSTAQRIQVRLAAPADHCLSMQDSVFQVPCTGSSTAHLDWG